tara:strand:- start:594 stop:773 length:180 start_codon:yes stop_codon:yes gene_type:complete
MNKTRVLIEEEGYVYKEIGGYIDGYLMDNFNKPHAIVILDNDDEIRCLPIDELQVVFDE